MLCDRGFLESTAEMTSPTRAKTSSTLSTPLPPTPAPLVMNAGGDFRSCMSPNDATSGSSAPTMALTIATPSTDRRLSAPGISAADW